MPDRARPARRHTSSRPFAPVGKRQMNPAAVRILIADDHPLFRKGVRALLSGEPDFEVVGEATSGSQAEALTESLQPDVVLMDLQMPNGGGIAATREIARATPSVRVLVVTL